MNNYFPGQIIILPFDSAPDGFDPCDGRLLSTSKYPTLFELIGTSFGGNGTTDFALPNYTGKAPAGSYYFIYTQEPAPQA